VSPHFKSKAAVRVTLSLVQGMAAFAVALAPEMFAQAPDVPVYRQGRRENQYEEQVRQAAKSLFAGSGTVVKLSDVNEQLQRTSCQLELPAPKSRQLSSRELCVLARQSHLRVGWVYLCDKCEQWHVNLAGGYALTADGAVATCFHVVQPDKGMREGCLIAADEDAKVYPVTEILAAHRYSDACIVRVDIPRVAALPLNTNVWPGDLAYCYSDPLDHRGYFSTGIVNRFYQFPGRRRFSAPAGSAYAPTRLNVSTDWAPGSSGSAVLDQFGNAIGHVSTISAMADEETSDTSDSHIVGPTMIVFHEAVSARDILRLIESK